MQKVKEFFKKLTLFDEIYLPIALSAVIAVSIIFKSDALSIIYSLISIIAIWMLTKGYFIAYFCLIVAYVIYVTQSWLNGVYGEVIVYLAVIIPFQIYAIVSRIVAKCKKTIKKEQKTIVIRTISWKEWLIVGFVSVGVLFGMYFMLKALGTKYLELSAILAVLTCLGNYLSSRGCFYNFITFLVVNILAALLWLMPLFYGLSNGTDFLPMVVSFACFTVLNVSGLINWIKLKKIQDKEEK